MFAACIGIAMHSVVFALCFFSKVTVVCVCVFPLISD